MDEAPLLKPEAKFLNHSTRIPRPISSGYELKQDIAPEIKRNLQSELNENKTQNLNRSILNEFFFFFWPNLKRKFSWFSTSLIF